ncbi:hypothetical protein MMC29_006127 [Sticta canariensis]|nr:hypothetical protein [Sticta canariensis]
MNIRRLNPNAVLLAQVVAGLQDRQEKVQLSTSEDSQLGRSQARPNGLLTALYNTRNVQSSPETTDNRYIGSFRFFDVVVVSEASASASGSLPLRVTSWIAKAERVVSDTTTTSKKRNGPIYLRIYQCGRLGNGRSKDQLRVAKPNATLPITTIIYRTPYPIGAIGHLASIKPFFFDLQSRPWLKPVFVLALTVFWLPASMASLSAELSALDPRPSTLVAFSKDQNPGRGV